jgi:hypothetical protein
MKWNHYSTHQLSAVIPREAGNPVLRSVWDYWVARFRER